MHEACVELGVSAALPRAPHQPQHRFLRPAKVGFERRVKMMRQRQVGVDLKAFPNATSARFRLPRISSTVEDRNFAVRR